VLTVLLMINTVPAQEYPGSSMDNALSRCRTILDTAARIACYDAIPEQQPGVNEAGRRAGDGGMQQDWQQREAMARTRDNAGSGNGRGDPGPGVIINEDGEQELIGRIAALEKDPGGWVVTLENGQIWRQVISKRYHLKEGQEVRIFPSGWGNGYRLAVEANGSFIQVKRLR
jgi:hypothetical protein